MENRFLQYNVKSEIRPPKNASEIWSVTVYDVGTRSEVETDQNKAAIGSIMNKPQANPDGSYDIYFGPKAPPRKEHILHVVELRTVKLSKLITCILGHNLQ
jgi:hypothetical protein